jgi:hypothetical protein
MKKHRETNRVLFISALCIAALPLSVWFAHEPLRANTAAELIDAGIVIQNKSNVEALVKSGLGWQALRTSMIQSGTNVTDVDNVIRVSTASMSKPFRYKQATAPLWPVLVKSAHLGSQKVWLIEGAAPSKPRIFDCGTGVTAWQRYRIRERNKQICAHRVLVVQANKPYALLASKDIRR